jgi:hypothetical protein
MKFSTHSLKIVIFNIVIFTQYSRAFMKYQKRKRRNTKRPKMKRAKIESRPLPSHLKSISDLKYIQWDSKNPIHFHILSDVNPEVKISRHKTVNLRNSKWLKKMLSDDDVWFKPILDHPDDVKTANKVDYLKSLLDFVDDKKLFLLARNLCNPFEGIGKLNFQNRSAVKLLEFDHLLSLLPKTKEKLIFYDICGGPGGFSEYIFSKITSAQGIGLTLKSSENGTADWSRIVTNIAESSGKSSFTAYYGPDKSTSAVTSHTSFSANTSHTSFSANTSHTSAGAATSHTSAGAAGDITDPSVLRGLANLRPSPSIILCDGGFSVDKDEKNQEIRHLHLILSQYLSALFCLPAAAATCGGEKKNDEKNGDEKNGCEKKNDEKNGGEKKGNEKKDDGKVKRGEDDEKKCGKFLCKVFNQKTFLSNYIFLLVSQFFEEYVPIKPNTSRVMNDERYKYLEKRRQIDLEEVEWMSTCLKWLYALYIALGKLGKATTLTEKDIVNVINSLPFPPPGKHLSDNLSYQQTNESMPPIWSTLVSEQKQSQELQLTSLSTFHEVLALFDTFAVIELGNFQVRKSVYSTFGPGKIPAPALCRDLINEWR